jgi:hypothetical protein
MRVFWRRARVERPDVARAGHLVELLVGELRRRRRHGDVAELARADERRARALPIDEHQLAIDLAGAEIGEQRDALPAAEKLA